MCKRLQDFRGSEVYLSAGNAHDHDEFSVHLCEQMNSEIKYFEGMRRVWYSTSRDQPLYLNVYMK